MKRAVIISDSHLEQGDEVHSSYLLVKKFIKYEKPDILVLNGDMLDFSYLSSYNESKHQLREGKRLAKDIEMFKKELDFFQKYSKKVIYLYGNHEERLVKTVERFPNLAEGILTIENLLNLKERNIEYYYEKDQPIRLEDSHLFMLHGKRFNIHFCAATVKDYLTNIVMGHTHRIQQFTMRGLDREFGAFGLGCLSAKNPDYLNGKFSQWANGFGYVYIHDDNNFTFNNIHIINDSFALNGKFWKL